MDTVEKVAYEFVKAEDPEFTIRLLYDCIDLLFNFIDLTYIDLWLLRILAQEVSQVLIS